MEFLKSKVHSCCIAMVDIDNFKIANDIHGHAVGDQVLITFARHLTACLRPYDKLFRYGGEEFLLCAVDADLLAGRRILERMRGELAAISHHNPSGGTFYVTVSVGLALLDQDATVEQSIERADKALYAAKAGGRNRIVVWDPSLV
jgi:diguanylate cyclase (GGDEF)-like protein